MDVNSGYAKKMFKAVNPMIGADIGYVKAVIQKYNLYF